MEYNIGMTKLKNPRKEKIVHVVLAYKIGMSSRSSRVFFEVFNSKNAAEAWCDTVSREGFTTQIQKKKVIM